MEEQLSPLWKRAETIIFNQEKVGSTFDEIFKLFNECPNTFMGFRLSLETKVMLLRCLLIKNSEDSKLLAKLSEFSRCALSFLQIDWKDILGGYMVLHDNEILNFFSNRKNHPLHNEVIFGFHLKQLDHELNSEKNENFDYNLAFQYFCINFPFVCDSALQDSKKELIFLDSSLKEKFKFYLPRFYQGYAINFFTFQKLIDAFKLEIANDLHLEIQPNNEKTFIKVLCKNNCDQKKLIKVYGGLPVIYQHQHEEETIENINKRKSDKK